jgi:hypothetical protein
VSLAQLHAAAVARVLSAPDIPCRWCGAALHTVADEVTDLWAAVDADGSCTGVDADVAHLYDPAANPLGAVNPWDALRLMAELMNAADHKAVMAGKACHTPLYWRVAAEYSALMVRLDMGLPFHVHSPMARHELPSAAELAARRGYRPPDLPYHCGWPAWLRPSGWHCRQCKLVLTDETAELAA